MRRILEERFVRRFCIGGFFAIVLVTAIFIHGDFGIGWDEKTQYMIGTQAFNSLAHGDPWPNHGDWEYFGTTFELPLAAIERMLDLSMDARATFSMRHLVTFLSFYGGVVALFFLARRHFRDWKWALLSCVFLVLSPRILGHAFYNSKDIPPLAFFIVAMLTLLRFTERQTFWRMALHAFMCAVVVTTRMAGLVLLPLTLLFLARAAALRTRGQGWRPFVMQLCRWGGLFLACSFLFIYVLWPYLWAHPLSNFAEAYMNMQSRVFGGFYMGHIVREPVWHWVPVWIAISTPLLYSALFLIGTGRRIVQCVTQPMRNFLHEETALLALCWFFFPLLSIIVLRAGIYDDWRHVYFIYPAFVLLAVDGARWLWTLLCRLPRGRLFAGTFGYVIVVSCAVTIAWMVENHPLESVYFSLPARAIEGNFELDYWGVSFREGFEYVLEHDPSPVVSIYPTGSAGWSVPNLLTPAQRRRVAVINSPEHAMYILDNFRGTEYRKTFPDVWKVHSVTAGGIEVLGVYKNADWDPKSAGPVKPWPESGILFFF